MRRNSTEAGHCRFIGGVLSAILAVLAAIVLGACGGSAQPDLSVEAQALDTTGFGELEDWQQPLLRSLPAQRPVPAGSESLPALKDLGSGRSASITGPGFHAVEPQAFAEARGETAEADDSLSLLGEGKLSFALYSVSGFDGDNFPTSAKIEVSTPGIEFHVGFTDYYSGRWIFSGPFNDSVEAEIPFSTQPEGLQDFVSGSGTTHFVIATQSSETLNISGLELGVDGGDEGPQPPRFMSVVGAAQGTVLNWTHSLSHDDVDFAGYLVERAPALFGSFESLSSEPDFDISFHDATAVPGESYRYRCAAVDTSGNKAYTDVYVEYLDPGTDTAPQLVLNYPRGILHSPAQVEFDFTGSQMPSGAAIDSYTVQFVPDDPIVSMDPVISTVLEPGCYMFLATVMAGGKQSSGYFQIKVLPGWQQAPTVIQETFAPGSALYGLRGGRLGPGGPVVLAGYDGMNTLSMRFMVRTNLGFDNFFQPMFDDFLANGEILSDGERLLLPVACTNNFFIMAFDGSDVRMVLNEENSGVYNTCALTGGGDGGNWFVYPATNMLKEELRIGRIEDGHFDFITLEDDAGAITKVDAAYNALARAVDIVYGHNGTTEWLRFSIDSETVVDSEVLDVAVATTAVDVEINPLFDEPAVAYKDVTANFVYQHHNGTMWLLPDYIDNSDLNGQELDLLFVGDQSYCTFGFGALTESILFNYDPDSSSWLQRNTPNDSTLTLNPGLLPGDEAGEVFSLRRSLAVAPDFVQLISLLPSDIDSEFGRIYNYPDYGRQIRGAGGSDGLHVATVDANLQLHHYVGSADGSSWSMPDAPAICAMVDIGANRDDEVYLSTFNLNVSGKYELNYWDPMSSSFVDQGVSVGGTWGHRPFISNSRSTETLWCYYDNVGSNLVMQEGAQMGGFSMSSFMPNELPVWRGAVGSANQPLPFVLSIGADPWDGVVGYLIEEGFNGLYKPLFVSDPPIDLLTNALVDGRTMDSTDFLAIPDNHVLLLPIQLVTCMACAHGTALNGYRHERAISPINIQRSEEIVFIDSIISEEQLIEQELKRTVSSTEAAGLTCVNLFSTITGDRSVFEWSNFGDWENIELPAGMKQFSRPELVVGADGQWHIVYSDLATGRIMCWSTN